MILTNVWNFKALMQNLMVWGTCLGFLFTVNIQQPQPIKHFTGYTCLCTIISFAQSNIGKLIKRTIKVFTVCVCCNCSTQIFCLSIYLLWYNVCLLFQGYYNQCQGQSQSQNMETSHDMQVRVTGTTGISWRKKPPTVSGTACEEVFNSFS